MNSYDILPPAKARGFPMMDAKELIRRLEEYRKFTKAKEDDVLIQIGFHVLELEKHVANIEFALGILVARETYNAKASRAPPTTKVAGIRDGDFL